MYVAPQQVAAAAMSHQVPATGPVKVRIALDYFHNGERQREPTIPFTPYAKKVIDALPAFVVVDDSNAPEMKLTLISTIDSDTATSQTLKSAFSAGFAEATFHRDWALKAELSGFRASPLSAESKDRFTVTTRSQNAPPGSVPLGAVDGHHALYDALIYPAMSKLINQMN
ncbi:protein of unknown function [Thauera humireducens]|nr:protein of unknown function [Thauera humireducens]